MRHTEQLNMPSRAARFESKSGIAVPAASALLGFALLLLIGAALPALAAQTNLIQLRNAVIHGEESLVQLMLPQRNDLGQEAEFLLREAAYWGRTNIVKLLIDQGVNPNASSASGWTALMSAARGGHLGIVQMLIARGADLKARNRNQSMSALLAAAESGRTPIVELLITKGADVNEVFEPGQTALIVAAKNGRLATVRRLLELGAEIEKQDGAGNTVLLLAAARGDEDVLKDLVVRKASVSLRNANGESALLLAVKNDHRRVAEALLAHGADPNNPGKDGTTPLMYAARNRNLDLAKALVERGADLTATNKQGSSVLSFSRGQSISEFMLQYASVAGIDTNALLYPIARDAGRNNSGPTVSQPKKNDPIVAENLVNAAREGNISRVAELLQQGAPPGSVNTFGWPAIVVAAEQGHTTVVAALLEHGVDANQQGRRQWTALMEAAKNGHFETVQLLVAKNAEINEHNYSGDTATDLAASYGHAEIAAFLEARGAKRAEPEILTDAAYKSKIELMRQLLDDDECGRYFKPYVSDALLIAVKYGQVDAAKFLFSRGADVNCKDMHPRVSEEYGGTPLGVVLSYPRFPEMVNVLITAGADVNLKAWRGQTPLELARQIRDAKLRDQIVEQLRKAGAKD